MSNVREYDRYIENMSLFHLAILAVDLAAFFEDRSFDYKGRNTTKDFDDWVNNLSTQESLSLLRSVLAKIENATNGTSNK